MQQKISIGIILFVASMQFAWNTGSAPNNLAVPAAQKWVIKELQLLQNELNNLRQANSDSVDKAVYFTARKHYKHTQFFIEYFSPLEAKLYINGPLVPKHEPDFGKQMIEPQGFQRIEEILYSTAKKNKSAELPEEVKRLQEQINNLIKYYSSAAFTDDMLLDMCQLELFRMAALNLNGYDATISQTNVQEAAWSLEGIKITIDFFKPHAQNISAIDCFTALEKELAHGQALLMANTNYSSFNRLNFITKFINPANSLLVKFHTLAKLPWNKNKKALQLANGFLFGKESFSLQFFSIYYDDTLYIKEQAALGRRLFNDRILSGNNQTSCGGCHKAALAFTDGQSKSAGLGNKPVNRNAPTLLNVIYQQAFFADGRAYQLEQQALDVIHNPVEMNNSLAAVVEKLQRNYYYKNNFARAFAHTIHQGITEYAVQKALAEYEKTLVSFNSRFDKYLHGSTAALNEREINGYNVFAGKALCGSCHFLPLFNGTVPPYFTDSEFEVIGIPANENNNKIDEDAGRYNVTQLAAHLHAFKTPTVRNAALTAPYMHNGVYKNLHQVVEFYHRGGGKGLGFDVPNQTLPFDSLQLSVKEIEDIILFMHSLTDTAGL